MEGAGMNTKLFNSKEICITRQVKNRHGEVIHIHEGKGKVTSGNFVAPVPMNNNQGKEDDKRSVGDN